MLNYFYRTPLGAGLDLEEKKKMRTGYFLIVIFLLGNLFGCQEVSQNKNQAAQNKNQTNQNDAAAKSEPLKLRLNKEDMATTENTSVLSKKFKAVFDNREQQGVLKEGTNEVEKTVHLQADRSVPAEEIAKLFGVLNSLSAAPILVPVNVPDKNKNAPLKPNPLTLVVYAGSGEYRPFNAGVVIGFMGELLENRFTVPGDKGEIAVVADKTGAYTMDGKQFSGGSIKSCGNGKKVKIAYPCFDQKT